MREALLNLSILCAIALPGCAQRANRPAITARSDLAGVIAEVDRRFNDVEIIEQEDLARLMQSRQPPVVLDVRSEAEYAVSHLPNAIRIDGQSPVSRQLNGIPRERLIVTYCSVGYRSSAFARDLKRVGYEHVRNLHGSIFEWAINRRLMVNLAGPTPFVHPYNGKWGRFLPPELRATEPK